MESYIYIAILLCVGLILFFLFNSPKKETKTKAQKQEELIFSYRQKLHHELSKYKDNPPLKSKKKIQLLKTFAQELQFNIFFSDEETKEIIENLAKEDI